MSKTIVIRSAPKTAKGWRRWVGHMEAHHRFGIALGVGVAAAMALTGRVRLAVELIAVWDAYAVTYLILAWSRMTTARPRVAHRMARLQHSNRTALFAVVLFGACASLGAVAFLLTTAKGLEKKPFATHVLAAIGTVILSWLLVHTIFTLYYAHLYYCPSRTGGCSGGLQFPEGDTHELDYMDFAYFSFVIGMTSQVSDVQIAASRIRRWALLHGMISFAFNAAILALCINILSGLF